MTARGAPPIRVNRAPALRLRATVVAERLGHPPETALILGGFVADPPWPVPQRWWDAEDARLSPKGHTRMVIHTNLRPRSEFPRAAFPCMMHNNGASTSIQPTKRLVASDAPDSDV